MSEFDQEPMVYCPLVVASVVILHPVYSTFPRAHGRRVTGRSLV
ncbi:MAG: hypothetical protein ACI85K_000244 [Hyphomicrobiaceae bacterium]